MAGAATLTTPPFDPGTFFVKSEYASETFIAKAHPK